VNLTPELFMKACQESKGRGVYSLKLWDVNIYTSLLNDALKGNYPAHGAVCFGNWQLSRTKPLSIDYVNRYRYEITLDRINSIEKLAHWVDHLHTKIWFNYKEIDKRKKQQADFHGDDPQSPENFFRVIVALNSRGIL
jgi:hypothetical protein